MQKVNDNKGVDEKDQTKQKASLEQITARRAMMWKVMPRNALRDIANWQRKMCLSSLQQVATPCIDDHQIPPEYFETAGELSAVCAQMVIKCLYLARSGRPDL